MQDLLSGPQGQFIRALEQYVAALWDALGEAGLPFPDSRSERSDKAWQEHPLVREMRDQVRSKFLAALDSGQIRRVAFDAWRRSSGARSDRWTLAPAWVTRTLMRNRRIIRSPQDLFDCLEAHFRICSIHPLRCVRMAAGAAAAQRGFESWLRRSRAARRALQVIERRGLSQGDLFIYLLTQRQLDCCLVLALTTEGLDVEASVLPLWARDATRWFREVQSRRLRTEMVVLDETTGKTRAWSTGELTPRIGVELADQLRLVAEVSARALDARHPADRFVVRLIWELTLDLMLETEAPDGEQSLASILRTLAAETPLLDALAETRDRLFEAELRRRWKRPVLRLTLLGALDATLYEQERQGFLRRSDPMYKKIVESVEDVAPETSTSLRSGLLPTLLRDPVRLGALGEREKRDPLFRLTVHVLRDIYDEAMGSITESVSQEIGSLDGFFLSSSSAQRTADSHRINPAALIFASHFAAQELLWPDVPAPSEPRSLEGAELFDDGVSEVSWKECLTEDERELLSLLEAHEQTEAQEWQ